MSSFPYFAQYFYLYSFLFINLIRQEAFIEITNVEKLLSKNADPKKSLWTMWITLLITYEIGLFDVGKILSPQI